MTRLFNYIVKILLENKLNSLHDENILLKSMIDSINCSIFITDTKEIIYNNVVFQNNFHAIELESVNFNEETTVFKNRIGENHTFKIIQVIEQKDNKYYVLKDISKDIELENIMNTFLHMDSLTELPNRAKLILDLRSKVSTITSLAIIDLKDFKEINDFYGNQIGDFILKSVAEFINSLLGEGQFLYKFHADTYCIANSTLNQNDFTRLVEDIINKIDDKVFNYDQYEIDTRAVAGLSFSSKNNKLITADLALQAAKKKP